MRVPDDMAMVGFDDIADTHFDVPLTTVHLPMHAIGQIAVQQLIGLIKGEILRSVQDCLVYQVDRATILGSPPGTA